MKKETYVKMTTYIKSKPKLARVLILINKIITKGIFVVYPVLLIWLFFTERQNIIRPIVVPFISFVALSIFRHFINRPRPYEKFDIPSVMQKDTVGKSFPSRHVFSAFIIVCTFWCFTGSLCVGIALIIISIILAVMRVVLGVHFISDVLAGAAFAILVSYIGYIVF